MTSVVPIPVSPEIRQKAIQQLDALLRQDPGDVSALLALGAIQYGVAGSLEIGEIRTNANRQAQDCYHRILKIEPGNPTALYRLGMLGWLRVHPELRAARERLEMHPDDPAPLCDESTRASLKALYAQEIASAMAHLERLIAADPESGAALSCLNLLFCSKAQLAESVEAARQDMARAGQFVEQALSAFQAEVARQAPDPSQTQPDLRFDSNGKVRFRTTVRPDGAMEELMLLSGHPALLRTAREAVRKMNFLPTQVPGRYETGAIVEVDFASE